MKQIIKNQFDYLLGLQKEFYRQLKEKSDYTYLDREHDTGLEIAAALLVVASQVGD